MAWASKFNRFACARKGTPGLARVSKTRHVPGSMNKPEQEFAEHLTAREDVLKWEFESWTVRLADDCRYTPDFRCVVRQPDGVCVVIFYEVKAQRSVKKKDKDTGAVTVNRKAHWEDDAKVKIRVAAKEYPEYLWIGVSKNKDGTWSADGFGAEG